MIGNNTRASEYRVRTLDRNDLNEKGKIYIGQGTTTTTIHEDDGNEVNCENGKLFFNIEAKNIIDAINDNANGRDISAGSFTAASFKGNADSATNATNATNATYAQYASADKTKGTIEQRLTNLGFKRLLNDRDGALSVSGAGLNASIRLLRSGTTREGNRTQASIQLSFYTTSAISGPLFSFFTGTEAISNVFIPAEYQPTETVTGFFRVRVSYRYDNAISFDAYIAVSCKVYGADTENAGKVTLQAMRPTTSGASMYIDSITLISNTNPAKLELGYSSKPL